MMEDNTVNIEKQSEQQNSGDSSSKNEMVEKTEESGASIYENSIKSDNSTFSMDMESETEYASNLLFQFIDIEEDKRIIDIVNTSYIEITEAFDLVHEANITFTIYKDQATFWKNTFGNNNNEKTTGYSNPEESVVKLTSPTDTSIKSEEDMLKVPVHEMVHILLPHNYLDIREGIAYYLAGQLRPYTKDDIPDNLSTIITYKGDGEMIQMSYNFAGYKTKFIIEECLNDNCVEYKRFMESPDDYNILGYNNEREFIKDFGEYLKKHAHR